MAVIDPTGGNNPLLSNFKLGQSMTSLIQQKLQERYVADMKKATEARQEVFDGQIKRYTDQSEKLSVVRGGIDLAVGSLGTVAANAQKIYDKLFDMKVYLEKAANDPDYYAQEFDKRLAEIYELADEVPATYNMIGAKRRIGMESRDVEVKIDQYANVVTLNGTFIGADYYITDSNGKKWVPEWSSYAIKQYDNYPNTETTETTYSTLQQASTTGASVSTSTIARTDTNYASDNISFEVDGTAYTGTLTKGGNDVGQSWLYGRFGDAQGIAQAQADVKAAMEQVEMVTAQVKASQVFVQGQYDTISNRIGEVKSEMTDVMVAQMKEEYDFQAKMRTKYDAMITNLASLSMTQKNYSQFLSSGLYQNKLLGFLYDQSS
ncbi:MAG: hypothetical protein IT565_03460 [Rhodospirillales bacterium]|nr:hypothetical protein [Rhodospirillales bacterium]